MNAQIHAARKRLRDIRNEVGPISSLNSILLGQLWEKALEKDPTGGQLMPMIDDFVDQRKPMKE